jgi:hypothetical protein
MNRFPLPMIGTLNAPVSFSSLKPSAGFATTVTPATLKPAYGWGPTDHASSANFANDAAAAEARERTLFSDSLLATAF